MATSVVVGILVLVLVLTFKKLKNRRREPIKEDINPVYGHYYKVDGERIDEGRVYAEDRNLYYQPA